MKSSGSDTGCQSCLVTMWKTQQNNSFGHIRFLYPSLLTEHDHTNVDQTCNMRPLVWILGLSSCHEESLPTPLLLEGNFHSVNGRRVSHSSPSLSLYLLSLLLNVSSPSIIPNVKLTVYVAMLWIGKQLKVQRIRGEGKWQLPLAKTSTGLTAFNSATSNDGGTKRVVKHSFSANKCRMYLKDRIVFLKKENCSSWGQFTGIHQVNTEMFDVQSLDNSGRRRQTNLKAFFISDIPLKSFSTHLVFHASFSLIS